jgi:hypothetical protein
VKTEVAAASNQRSVHILARSLCRDLAAQGFEDRGGRVARAR